MITKKNNQASRRSRSTKNSAEVNFFILSFLHSPRGKIQDIADNTTPGGDGA